MTRALVVVAGIGLASLVERDSLGVLVLVLVVLVALFGGQW